MSASPQMPAVEMSMSLRTWALLGLLSLLWGCSFPFVKIALGGVTPLTLVMSRVVIAVVALTPVLMLSPEGVPRGAKVWTAFLAIGALNNVVPWSLSVWAQQSLTSSFAAIVNATTPLFSVLLAPFFLADERLRANRLAGVLVGFLGVAVLIGPGALGHGAAGILPELALLAAAVAYAFGGIVGRSYARLGLTPLQSAHGQLAASSIMITPLALIVEQPWNLPTPTHAQIACVLAMGLVSTAVAFILFFRILARAGATNALLVTLLVPVTAFIVSAIFLGETLEPRNLAGLAFIAAGLGLIDGRPLRYIRSRLFAPSAP
ncbi:MAG TPA: DMT family transporter [Rhodoblastus sp.]|nr:DMT family transporter [Rhodoblastus sp.]